MTPEQVVEGVLAGRRRAIGRAITMAESRGPEGRAVMRALHPRGGRALRVGITGSPGAGKSTLSAALVRHLRAEGRTVAIVSVDPTSPFTHGAVLGDRIRLVDHFLDEGVFIRSMASRGHLGGLAEATGDAHAKQDTVVLVLMPGSGDAIQAIKAGVMEIPDVIVINKCDRPGADILAGEVESALTLVPPDGWVPPVVLTQALEGQGVEDAWAAVERHQADLRESGRADQRARDGMQRHLRSLALERLARDLDARVDPEQLDALVDRVVRRQVDPAAAVDTILGAAPPEEA